MDIPHFSQKPREMGHADSGGPVGVRDRTCTTLPDPHNFLGFGGEVVADAVDGVALGVVQGEEFESVAQALAVAHNSPHFDGIRRQGQGDFQRDDLSGFKAAG